MNKKRAAFLMAFILLMALAVSAGARVLKDEVVYARLTPKGQPEAIYVVNDFEADTQTQVTDYGSYVSALPLAPAEGFAYAEDSTTFMMSAGRFAYQGTLIQGTLPWVIAVSYRLNGEQIDPGALSGADGKLEITLSVMPEDSMRAYADSLTLQVTITLNREKCLNIQADRATSATAGKSQTLSYVILPGQDAEYTLSADVVDFSMDDIQAAGVRMVFDAQMYQDMFTQSMAGSPFEAVIGDVAGNLIGNMQGADPVSFTDSRNDVRSLQFVLLIEGIPQQEVQAPAEVEPAPETVWDRLLHLLGL